MSEKLLALEEIPVVPPSLDHEETCQLCGLPLSRAAPGFYPVKDQHQFCCIGCQQVFYLLSSATGVLPSEFRDSELYKVCVAAGVIPAGRYVPSAEQIEETPINESLDTAALELTLRVEGMWCPSCAWLIEEILKKTPGVLQPSVSFFSDIIQVRYQPHLVTPKEIESCVGKLGYKAVTPGEDKGKAKADLLVRLSVSAILTMNTMMLSWALYSGFVRNLSTTAVTYLSYPLLIITLPVIFYSGMPILRRAWAGLRFGKISMDTFITISALSAFIYSVIAMTRNSIHLYFDTATMLITLVLFGRYVEMYTRDRVSSAFRELDEMGRHKVRLSGRTPEKWVAAEAVMPGNHFIVLASERIPLDGRISDGKGFLDQSALTGEARVVKKGPGDEVMAGSLLVEGRLEVVAISLAKESSLRHMVNLMIDALDRKNAREELVDFLSRMFVPLILAVAVITGSILWFNGYTADEVLIRCLTILLIACPCALGIAAPLGKVAMIGLGHKKGILIRNHEALEQVKKLDTVVLDKTGTVTQGDFALRHIVCSGVDESIAFSMIAAIEKESNHVIAREIMRYARSRGIVRQNPNMVESLDGLGIRGTVAGKMVFIGNRCLLSRCDVKLNQPLNETAGDYEQKAMTVVFFGWDGEVMGLLAFGDRIREDAQELIDWLQKRQIHVVLLSGDDQKTTKAVAQSLGIDESYGQNLPSDKVALIRSLQEQGHKTGMVGDGINDSGALAQADVAFAMGSGHVIMKEASDLLIPSGRLVLVADAFDLSERSVRMIRQNLSLSLLYNATAIPVAAAGFLSPLIAVSAMFLNSLSVIGNTLRISKNKGGSPC